MEKDSLPDAHGTIFDEILEASRASNVLATAKREVTTKEAQLLRDKGLEGEDVLLLVEKGFTGKGILALLNKGHTIDTILTALDGLNSYEILNMPVHPLNHLEIRLLDEMTFDELSSILHDMKFIFNQCPLIRKANNNDEVKITGVKSGSIWFFLGIASVALPIVGSIMGLTFKFLHNILFLRQQEKAFRAQKNGNEMAEAVAKVITAQANMLASQFNADEKHELEFEDIAKLAKTIELLGGLVERNILMQPSIAAPKETKDKFPKLEEYKEIVQLLGGPKPIAALKQANDE